MNPTHAEISAYAAFLHASFISAGFVHADVEIWLMAERFLQGKPSPNPYHISNRGGEK